MSSNTSTRTRFSPYSSNKTPGQFYKSNSMETILFNLSTKVVSLEEKYLEFVNYCTRLLSENKFVIEQRLESDYGDLSTNYHSQLSSDKEKLGRELDFMLSVKNSLNASPKQSDSCETILKFIKSTEQKILEICLNEIYSYDISEVKETIYVLFDNLSRQISEIIMTNSSAQREQALREKINVLIKDKQFLEEKVMNLNYDLNNDMKIQREKFKQSLIDLQIENKTLVSKLKGANSEVDEFLDRPLPTVRSEERFSIRRIIKEGEANLSSYKKEREINKLERARYQSRSPTPNTPNILQENQLIELSDENENLKQKLASSQK